MPNRILKDSICTSDNLDMLTAFQETVFYRLLVNCDDYGRFDARPKILASKLFPLKEVRVNQIEDALRALTSAELVTLYKVDGKPFLQMKKWDKHQQIRSKKSKYPGPAAGEIVCNQMQSDASKCPRNPIQSESESNPNTNDNNNNNRARARENPYSDEYTPVDPDPVVGYAARVLVGLSPNNVDELVSFRDSLPDDVIVHAIDETAANGTRNYSYTRKILNEYVRRGFKTIGDIKAYEDRRKGGVTDGNDAKPAADDDADLWAGMSEEDIKLVEQLANDGQHFG